VLILSDGFLACVFYRNAVNSSEVSSVILWSKTIFTVMRLLAWWQKLIMPW